MPVWTAETVIALAPDAASISAGRGLADAGKWASAGANEAAAWGEAKGSGSKPYQVTVDLGDGASKCSCPSRKFPCKHALGLLLRIAKGDVPNGEPPDWATDWVEKRGQKAAPKVAPAPPSAKTVEKRWDTVQKGLDECEAFLRDAVGNGLLALSSARSWDEMARRMTDAKAQGVGRRLRAIGSAVGVDNARAAADLGSLALLIEAARRGDELGDLAYDVRTALGVPTPDDSAETVVDVWDAVGTFGDQEDRLWTRRTWFLGRQTGRWALHLAFAAGNAPPPPLAPFGAALAAEARFSPSAWPLRATLESASPREFEPRRGGTWAEAFEAQANALALNPWIELFPVLLRDATLAQGEARWLVVDAEGVGVTLANGSEEREWLLGRTGNLPCEIFGEFDGERFTLVSYREIES